MKRTPIEPVSDREIMQAVSAQPDRTKALVYLLRLTACRISEALRIKADYLAIREHDNEKYLYVMSPNLKHRTRKWKENVVAKLDKSILGQMAQFVLDYSAKQSGFLFPSPQADIAGFAKPISRQYAAELIKKIKVKSRQFDQASGQINMIERPLHPHYFRHVALTWRTSHGETPQDSAFFAGHSDLRQIMRYYHGSQTKQIDLLK